MADQETALSEQLDSSPVPGNVHITGIPPLRTMPTGRRPGGFEGPGGVRPVPGDPIQVNGNETAWFCENHFDTEPDIQMACSVETFARDVEGNLIIQTYHPMPSR